MIYFILVLFAAAIAVAVIVVKKNLNLLKSGGKNTTIAPANSKTAQEFLPFVTIENGVIDLGGFCYRAVIECSSVNYALKTSEEKDVMENQFRKFLDSVDFPISIFVQTKEINYGTIMDSLKKDIEKTLTVYPAFGEYAENYFSEMEHLKQTMGNTKQKRKYIIVPYEDSVALDMSPEDKKAYSVKEAITRAKQVASSLQGIGIHTKVLSNEDVIELIYSMYHRDDDAFIEGVGTGEYTADIVTSDKPTAKIDKTDDAIRIIQEAENRLKITVMEDNLPYGASQFLSALIMGIDDYKQRLIEVKAKGGIEAIKSLEEEFSDCLASEENKPTEE